MQFNIDMRILKAAYLFTSKESTRYYLNGVAIEWNGQHLTAVATDGHRLIAFNLPHEEDGFVGADKFSVIIPNDIIKNWKLDKRALPEATFIYTPESASDPASCSLSSSGTSITFAPLDGTYPDWRRTIPAELSGKVAQFDTGYLDDFTRATKILYGTERFITVRHNGGAPAIIDMATDNDFEILAVLMPRRGREHEEYVKPEFCK